jgi:phosphatidylinositol-3-phosphatase
MTTAIRSLIYFFLLISITGNRTYAQAVLPVPDHIIIAILENHSYQQIIGSEAAPNINALATDPHSALFTRSFALEHPSQPNYLDLYSGSNQGVTDNGFPTVNPFLSPNLGRQLLDAGKTFITYAEDLPYTGYNGIISGNYVRKHNPVANWMGAETNQVPEATNQPFTAFPSADFTFLPTVSFIIPNQVNNMHDGVDPLRITQSDAWIYDNLNSFIQWAKTHNSLFILTWDEDSYYNSNQIVTIFTGQMVNAGEYADSVNHYDILRTIEDMYGLSYAGNAATAVPITNCWKIADGINEPGLNEKSFSIYSGPPGGGLSIKIECSGFVPVGFVEICNMLGESIYKKTFNTSFPVEIDLNAIPHGVYFVRVSDGKRLFVRKVMV